MAASDLRDSLCSDMLSAFGRHCVSTELVFSSNPVRYFRPAVPKMLDEKYYGQDVSRRLRYLRKKSVQSALLGYWMHENDDIDAIQAVHEATDNALQPADELDWRIKEQLDPNGSGLRFYVAKAKLGTLSVAHGHDATLVERHTYAAYAMNGRTPRRSDIKHILEVEPRHPLDQRPVVAARTSTSFYAFKPAPNGQ